MTRRQGETIDQIKNVTEAITHVDQVKEQLARPVHKAPQLVLPEEGKPLEEYQPQDITLANYEHEAAIKAPVAV